MKKRLSCQRFGKQRFDVGVLVLVMEEDVTREHVVLLDCPLQLHHVRWRVRNNEAVENDRGIAKPVLNLLDRLKELNLRVRINV